MNTNEHKFIFFRFICVYLCLFVANFFGGCGRGDGGAGGGGGLVLNVISPHGSDIRREFARGFSDWHLKAYGEGVRIEWHDIGSGGTENVTKFLGEVYKSSGSSGDDVVFGGGSDAFIGYAGRGFLAAAPGWDGKVWGRDPIGGVPGDIFGTPLHGEGWKAGGGGGVWVAAAMSSFGMEVNKERVVELGMTMPRVWEDMAGPEWFGRLSLADPSKSGSVKSSYEMIFQQYGWEKGWGVITRLFANAVLVRDAGAAPAEDVGSAEAVGGIVIDFFGRIHVSRAGAGIVTFVIPEGGSALDPDPIAMLKGAPHAELAGRFIRYVVSEQGQRLWTFRPGVGGGGGGPKKSALGRLSVLPGVYEREGGKMVDGANPFAGAAPLKVDVKARAARGKFIGDLIKAALIDNQRELARAREAIHRAGDRAELLAKLERVPNFMRSRVSGGELVWDAERPVLAGDQEDLAEEYMPGDKEKGAYAERLQTGLKDLWRREFRVRFEELSRGGG